MTVRLTEEVLDRSIERFEVLYSCLPRYLEGSYADLHDVEDLTRYCRVSELGGCISTPLGDILLRHSMRCRVPCLVGDEDYHRLEVDL